MTAAGCRQLPTSAKPRTLPRFNAEFIERRMREHREHMDEYAAQLATDIVYEVAAAMDQARRAAERKRLGK